MPNVVQRFPGAGIAALLLASALLAPSGSTAVPAFEPQDIGVGVPIDTNAAGLVLGMDAYSASRPWVFDGRSVTLLPLPAGVATATAHRIGAGGAVVGQVGNQAAVWWPTSQGGYELDLLAYPPGATVGKAIDVNVSGTVLLSFGTPGTLVTGYQYMSYKPYLYTRQGGAVDLGAIYPAMPDNPDPVDLTDSGRILLSAGQILEPGGQVTATPPFPEPAAGGYHWTFLRALRINEAGTFVGVATLSSSMGYAQVVRYAPATGWKVLGGLSVNVGPVGIDEASNTVLFANYVCPVNFGLGYAAAAGGTYCLDDLVLGGGWSFQSFASKGALSPGALNLGEPGVGGIVALGYHAASGAYRLARLTPAGALPPPPAVALAARPHPGTWSQPWDAITLSWSSAGPLAKAYGIERRAADGRYVELARIGATVTEYQDQAIEALKDYTYRVTAIGLAGAGPYSNLASAVAPAPMDRSAPLVTIDSPADGSALSGIVSLGATFTDNVGLIYASFSYSPNMGSGLICSKSLATAATPLTLSCNWDTRKLSNQPATAVLEAYGHDAMGNWVQQSITVNLSYGGKGGGKGGKPGR